MAGNDVWDIHAPLDRSNLGSARDLLSHLNRRLIAQKPRTKVTRWPANQ
jgi:hypothetical protein